MSEFAIVEYESGWYIERPMPGTTLEDCVFEQVRGPYKTKESAEKNLYRLALEMIRVGHVGRAAKLP